MKLFSYLCSLALLLMSAYLYGRFSHSHGWFPEPLMRSAVAGWYKLRVDSSQTLPEYLVAVKPGPRLVVNGTPSSGLRLISSIDADGLINVQAVNAQGQVEHRWDLDWFKTWKGPTGDLPQYEKPKERPGTAVEGMVVSPDGDLTFNFSKVGAARVDVCGKVKWLLPSKSHHSLTVDEDGNYWAPATAHRDAPDPRYPNYEPSFRDYSVVAISPDGHVVKEISIADVLLKNGLQGMLYLTTRDNYSTQVTGDTLHLNDVDIFPRGATPGVVQPGDIMVSLRNPNVVMIFDPKTLKIRHIVRDRFVRQHDPDFIDGNRITVFDNNNVGGLPYGAQSRLIEIDLRDDTVTTLFSGTPSKPFFTQVMGMAEQLPNRDYMLVEADKGRVIEVSLAGDIVWDYRNFVTADVASVIQDVAFTEVDLKTLGARCKTPPR